MLGREKMQVRYENLQKLHNHYQTHVMISQYLKIVALGLIGSAWILTLFFGFSMPFFFMHTLGTSLWLYQYISTTSLKTQWDLLKDPMFWFLLIITIIGGIYVLIAFSRCSLNGPIF